MNMEGVSQGRYADIYSPVRPFTPEERARGPGAHAGDLRHVRREGGGRAQHHAGADRRDRAGARVDRTAGEGDRAGRRARRPRARARARQASAPRSPPDAEVELVVYPPKKSLYESLADPFGTHRPRGRSSARCSASATRRALQALTAPLRVFRRGEPLAIMPNVFVRIGDMRRSQALGARRGAMSSAVTGCLGATLGDWETLLPSDRTRHHRIDPRARARRRDQGARDQGDDASERGDAARRSADPVRSDAEEQRCMNRVSANAPADAERDAEPPMITPWRTIISRMPRGVAPSAIRMPISRVPWLTRYAITP